MRNNLMLRAASWLAFGGLGATALAQLAKDEASKSVYVIGQEYIQVGTPPGNQTAATNGLNGGSGFNQWQRGGYGDPPNHGTTVITNLAGSFNMGTKQWNMRSGPGGLNGADARRRLLTPINVGDTWFLSMMAGGNGAGSLNTIGEFGAEFRSSLLSNPGRDMATIIGEMGRNWRVFRSGGTLESTLPVVAGERIDVIMRVMANDTFACTFINPAGVCSTVSGTFLSLGQQIQTCQFYCFGTDGDFYINNLAVYEGQPPSSYAIVAGTNFGGNVASLGGSDEDKVFILNDETEPNATIEITTKCVSQPATSATIKFEISATRNDLSVFMDTFKYGSTNNWVNRDFSLSSLTDVTRTVNLTGTNVADLVSLGGDAKSRIRWIPTSDLEAADGWSEAIDRYTTILN